MGIIRLQSGTILEAEPSVISDPSDPNPNPSADPNVLERPACLVYVGKFQSLDGEVEVTETDLDVMIARHNSFIEKLKRMAKGELRIGAMPPAQVDHSTSGWDTVGRLVGPIFKKEYEIDEGIIVPAVFGTIRFLGKDNIDRVLDERWSNLSIGADFKTGKIGEITVTPFPAAQEAKILTAGSRLGGEMDQYRKGLKRHLEGLGYDMESMWGDKEMKSHQAMMKMFEGEDDVSEALGKHMGGILKKMEGMDAKAMPDHVKEGLTHNLKGMRRHLEYGGQKSIVDMVDHMMKKLIENSPEDTTVENPEPNAATPVTDPKQTEMASTEETEETKMAKEEEEKKKALKEGKDAKEIDEKEELKKLSAIKGQITQLKQQAKAAQIEIRLMKLQAQAKIIPAERAKIDIKRLASQSEETIEAVLSTYENRILPVVHTGVYGSKGAEDLAQVSREMNIQRMMSEARSNMPLFKSMDQAKAKLAKGKLQSEEETEVNIHIDALPKGEHDTEMAAIEKLMDEGKIPEAKEKLKAYMTKRMEAKPVEMTGLMENLEKLSKDMEGIKL